MTEIVLLLSAGLGLLVRELGCGIGTWMKLRLIHMLRAVLDFLETSKWGFGGDQPPIIKLLFYRRKSVELNLFFGI